MRAVLPGTTPNVLQEAAISASVSGAQKIVAGAGTGKTSTMVRRFAHLVERHGLDPNRILAVTFTNRAAAELRDRVTEELLTGGLIPDRASLDTAWIGTFHALCARLLREDCYEIGFDRDTGVIDQLEERLLVKEVQRALRDGEIPGAGILELEGIGIEGAFKLSSETFGFIQRMKGMGLTPDVLDQHCCDAAESFWRTVVEPEQPDGGGGEERVAEDEAAKLICATYTEYERRLADRRMLDFDGILLRTREALRSHTSWAERCRDRFQYLIVDEFQDTNRVQLEVLELLAQPGFANVSVVGDPKQSIYGWRDAEIRNILEFDGESRRLTTNYRSVQPILDLATHIIRVDPQFADEPPLVAEGRPGRPDSVSMYSATSPDEEAQFMAAEILKLRQQGRAWSEIAILTRMRRPPVAFEQELRRAGIPYVTAGGHGFFEREEIKDLMSCIGVIHDPLDEQALVRMLQGPLVRCTDGEIYRMFRRRRRETGTLHGWDALEAAEAEGFPELDDSTRARVHEAVALVRRHMASKAGVSTSELVQAVIDETGYAAHAAGDVSESDRRLGNIRKLYRMATEFETRQVFSGLGDFIDYVDLHAEHEIEVGEADISGADAVRFLTVHAAKGLEFPVVFLAHVKPFREQHRGWIFFDQEMGLILRNLGDGVETRKHVAWKKARAGNLPMDLERGEMRRLMYVAITRAKERLYLSTTRKDEPTWDSVMSELDARDRPRQKPDDDFFRTLALFARDSGAAALLPRSAWETGYVRPRAVGGDHPARQQHLIARPVTGSGASHSSAGTRVEVSFSQLEAFTQCPLRYQYIYEWRVPAPPDGLWPEEKASSTASVPASVLGTVVHSTLEEFHRPGPGDGRGGMDRLHQLWSDAARGVLTDQEAQATWTTTVVPMFERYLALDVATFRTIATEQEFNLIESVDGQEVLIRGFIDRLCEGPDGTVLVDYKTNTAIGAGSVAAYSRQLAIYERASRVILALKPQPVLIELRRGLVHRLDSASSWEGVEEMLRSIVMGRRIAPNRPPCGPCAYKRVRASLQGLLHDIDEGKIQLPDFQRGWVWDDEHVRSLLASISLGFPIGAVMVLQTGNPKVRFKPRPVEGVRLKPGCDPDQLILDGQQRLTSLYQALFMSEPVSTQDARKAAIQRYYYIDASKALDPAADREEAIFGVPPDRIVKNFRGGVVTDISTPEKESLAEALPVSALFDVGRLTQWMMAYLHTPNGISVERQERFNRIMEHIIQPFQQYQVPLILLTRATSKEAVCKVFEKVNTGGVSLTVFELLTATYAADDYNLRDDWDVRKSQLAKYRVLGHIENTDVLQTIALLSTLERKRQNPELGVGCKRRDILDLELSEYRRWADVAISGYERAARFLFDQHLFAARDIPYRTQLIPLAAILGDLGGQPGEGTAAKIRQWYWSGVLGELYGGSIETRFARDVPQVLAWIDGGPEPDTIAEANFRPDRLRTLRTRNSAAYKGIHALLMRDGAMDFRSGKTMDSHVYFDDQVDVHHIFPWAWAVKQGVDLGLADCIVNKTPLSASSNRIIGGAAPSQYLRKLEQEAQIPEQRMDELIASHVIDSQALRADDFAAFFRAREEAILDRIETAMSKPVTGRAVDRPLTVPVDGLEGVEAEAGPVVPPEAKAIVIVEGATDEQYLRLAAEVSGRPELLRGLFILPCSGVNGVVQQAVLFQSKDSRPLVTVFDRDAVGKAGLSTLANRFRFRKPQLMTYADVLEGAPDLVEAEDLFPASLMQRFVDEHGEEQVLSEKQMHPQLRTWHYGFNALGKDVIADFLRLNAGPDDFRVWVRLLELIRTRVGLSNVIAVEARTDVSGSAAEFGTASEEASPEGAGVNTERAEDHSAPPEGASSNGVHLDEFAADAPIDGKRLDPWQADGRSWHLEQNCTPKTRPMVEAVADLVAAAAPAAVGPHWNQRHYISWRDPGRTRRNWLALHPRGAWIWIEFNYPSRSAEQMAGELGLRFVAQGEKVDWANEGLSQVMASRGGAVEIQIRRFEDLQGPAADSLRRVIAEEWAAYQEGPLAMGPLGSTRTESGDYDWSRIDAAVARLPAGRWTSYGDLAQLGGTGSIAVGARMAAADMPNAYRVLDGQGRIRPGFHWHDAGDSRDVREVLTTDGIRFDESGAADPLQRLSLAELAELARTELLEARESSAATEAVEPEVPASVRLQQAAGSETSG